MYLQRQGHDSLEEAGLGVVDLAEVDLGVAGWQWAEAGSVLAEEETTLEAVGYRLAVGEEGRLAAAGWLQEDCAPLSGWHLY